MSNEIHQDESRESGAVTLPRWFLYVTGAASTVFVALFMPWAIWVTVTLMSINFSLPPGIEAAKTVNSLTGRVDRLDDRETAFRKEVDERFNRAESRISKIEK